MSVVGGRITSVSFNVEGVFVARCPATGKSVLLLKTEYSLAITRKPFHISNRVLHAPDYAQLYDLSDEVIAIDTTMGTPRDINKAGFGFLAEYVNA